MSTKKQTKRLRIEAIEIQSNNPPNYPVNVKILSNDVVLEILATIRPGQQLRWDTIKPVDVEPTSNIELRVYEAHKMGLVRVRIGSISFAADTSETSIERDITGSVQFTVSITLLQEAKGQQAAQNAYQSALKVIEDFPSVLDSIGRARGAVESILGFGSAVSELNPIAKATLGICTKAWEILKKQDQCDTITADLVLGLGNMVPVVKAVPDRAKAQRLKGTIADILRLVEDGCNFVIEYRSDGAAVRTLHAFANSNAQEQVDEYLKELGRLKEKFDREMMAHLAEATEILLTDADQALITTLLTTGSGYDHHPTCLAGTRRKILSDILQWATTPNDSTSIFWLYGLAGSGKSTIAASASAVLQNSGLLAGSFFCKHDELQLREPKNLVSTLAGRLARTYKPYGVKLVQVLRDNPEIVDSALSNRFDRLIMDPLHGIDRLSLNRNLVLVIDALDECGTPDSRKQVVLSLLQLSATASWLKVLLTSRPNHEIYQVLIGRQTSGLLSRDLTKEDQSQVTSDISIFVAARLQEIPSNEMGRTTWPEEDVVQEISARASGLFIWAETACRFIATSLDPNARLKDILMGQRSNDATYQLNQLYATALDKSFHKSEDNSRIIRQCVGAIVLTGAYSPLSDTVLGALLEGYIDANVLHRVINALGSVIYRDKNGAVRVLHQSFSDFVLDQVQCPLQYKIDLPLQNRELALCCLRVMIKNLKFNICNLENSFIPDNAVPDLPSRAKKHISTQLSYSCLNWINHLTLAPRDVLDRGVLSGSPITKSLEQFISQPLSLYWIEALSLLGGLKSTLVKLPKLLDWVADYHHPYGRWAYDIHCFLFAFYDPIVISVPHLYVSALPFGAANFETVRRWKSQFQGTVTVIQGQNLLPSSSLRVIEDFPTPNPRIKCISPDGRHIVLANSRVLISLDAETGEVDRIIISEHNQEITCAACSWDSGFVATGSEDTMIHVRDFGENPDAFFRTLQGHTDWLIEVLFAPDGRSLISGSYDQTIRVWDIESGTQIAEIQLEHSSPITSIRLSSDGRSVTSTFKNNMLLTWEIATQNVSIQSLQKFPQLVRVTFAFSSDGLMLVAGTDERKIYVWDVPTGRLLLGPLEGHSSEITSITLSPDDFLIVSGSEDGEICLWDSKTGVVYSESFTCHSGPITGLIFTVDDQRILSSSEDNTVRMWRRPRPKTDIRESSHHTMLINSVAFSPDGSLIASGSLDSTIGIWDSWTGISIVGRLHGHSAGVTSVAFSPNGQHIVSGSEDCTVRIWKINTDCEMQPETLRGHTDWVNCVTFSPDGSFVASGSDDGTVRLWDAHTGRILTEPWRSQGGSVKSLAFSSTGQYLSTGSIKSLIQIWEVNSGVVIQEIAPEHSCSIDSIAFSPNELYLASAGTDDQVTIWNRQTGTRALEPFIGHSDSVMSVAFSPDGTYIASASVDATIRVWNARTGALVWGPLRGHQRYITSIAFCSEGNRIVSGAADATIRIWDLPVRLDGDRAQSATELDLSSFDQISEEIRPSVPSWAFRNMLQGDGWISNSKEELILRIPEQYQRHDIDQSSLVISPRLSDSHVTLDFSKFQAGTSWTHCKAGKQSPS